MLIVRPSHTAVCLNLTEAISTARTVDDIYTAALDALTCHINGQAFATAPALEQRIVALKKQ